MSVEGSKHRRPIGPKTPAEGPLTAGLEFCVDETVPLEPPMRRSLPAITGPGINAQGSPYEPSDNAGPFFLCGLCPIMKPNVWSRRVVHSGPSTERSSVDARLRLLENQIARLTHQQAPPLLIEQFHSRLEAIEGKLKQQYQQVVVLKDSDEEQKVPTPAKYIAGMKATC